MSSPPPEFSKGARLRLAMIGCGGKAADLSRTAAPFGDFVACCDVDRAHARKFSDGKMDEYGDYRELLKRDDIDAVFNATPDHWHTTINVAALRAGLPVFCEKPLTLTIDEGKVLRRTLEETGGVLQVGAQQRSAPSFRRAVAIAQSGLLGDTVVATCYFAQGKSGGPFQPATPPADLDWDFWLGPAPEVPYFEERCHKSFRWWFDYSGGKLTDWGAHHIDIAQWGIGAQNTGPIEVEGEGVLDDRPDCFNTAQTFDCTLRFANGNTILVKDGPGSGIRFEGEKGHIFVGRKELSGDLIENAPPDIEEKIDADVAALYPGPLGIPDEEFPPPGIFDRDWWGKVKTSHIGNFFNCIRDGSQPISDVPSLHRTTSSCHLCNIAMRLKRKLRWDPDNEDFIDDAEASSMVRREPREPYGSEG
jgi:myo-inositol 2-dehydrogenase/D-chiro-inositol 1-dehydrogenase